MLFLLYGYIVPRYNKSWGSWEFRDLLRQGLAPESIPPPAMSGTGKSAHILWTVKKFFLHMFLVHGFWFFLCIYYLKRVIQKEFPNPVSTLTVTFKNYNLGGCRKWCLAYLTSAGFKYLLGQRSFEEAGSLEDLRQVTFIEVYENLNSILEI